MKVAVEGLSVSYGVVEAVKDIAFSSESGQVLGVLGPNGSGKSSLIRALAGLTAFEGQIRFDDKPNRPQDMAYMPQDIGTKAALTVLEVVLLGRLRDLGLKVSPDDLAAAEKVLTLLGLAPLSERYLGELSGGQRQLVFLAQAMVSEPRLLLLDEPISALDIRHQLDVMQILRTLSRDNGMTIIVVLHDLTMALRFCETALLMCKGRAVAFGTSAEVLSEKAIAQTYDVQSSIVALANGLKAVVAY